MDRRTFRLKKECTGVMVIDMQEKLVAAVERSCEVVRNCQRLIEAAGHLELPIVVTEQYPEGLGRTLPGIRECLGKEMPYHGKTTFSALGDSGIEERLRTLAMDQWILVGIEAHICVLQTARDLILNGQDVVVLNDTTSSRSIFDYSTAMAELQGLGARVSSLETVIFELVRDSKQAAFPAISQIIKESQAAFQTVEI